MGFSFGELVVLALVALIVIGPKDLPKMLRAAGRTIGSLKRLVSDVRRETGLDEVLRGDFQDLERLADHIERLDDGKPEESAEKLSLPNVEDEKARREREYPRIGADSYALLPEDAPVYGELGGLPEVRAAEGTVAQASHGSADEPRASAPSHEEAPAT